MKPSAKPVNGSISREPRHLLHGCGLLIGILVSLLSLEREAEEKVADEKLRE